MRIRNFTSNDRGNVAIIFSLMATVLLLVSGVAIDYALAVNRKRHLDFALDAAILAGVNAASAADRDGKADWSDIGKQAANSIMRANLNGAQQKTLKEFNANFVKQGSKIVGIANYDGVSPNILMPIFGKTTIPLSNIANAAVDPGNYVDINFLIDNSSSMGIGVDAAAQTLMRTTIGKNSNGQTGVSNCELACHFYDGHYVLTPQAANAAGAKLRIDVAREAVIDSIKSLKAKGLPADRIRVSLHTFSHGIKTVSDATSDLSLAATRAESITLDNTNTGGGTYLWKSIGQLSAKLGKGGTGRTSTDRLSFVVIFTDGVENNGQMIFASGIQSYFSPSSNASEWKYNSIGGTHPIGTRIQPLVASGCDGLKSTTSSASGGHLVFSVQVEYFIGPEIRKDSPWQTGVIENITNDVDASLKTCASESSYYVKAADSNAIKPAFKKVMDEIAGAQVAYLSR